jgi:uncharacterized protein (DUF362 family)
MSFDPPTSRRRFLSRALSGAAGFCLLPIPDPSMPLLGAPPFEELPEDLRAIPDRSASAPSSPVAVERCRDYEPKSLAAGMEKLFDRIGGLGRLMAGKTVTVKLNITGDGRQKMAGRPAERTYQTHPAMVEVLCGLFAKAGARRIILAESYYRRQAPEAILARHGWDIDRIRSAGDQRVSFEDTRNRGAFKDYVELAVPYGGYVFGKYQLNRRYHDTDVFVSLAKLKNHITAGITCSVKNLFGLAPTALYGNDAPNEDTTENRGEVLHFGSRAVPAGVAPERFRTPDAIARKGKNEVSFYRVPRVTADLIALRPVDLAIIDAIESVSGGEGPWCPPPHKHTTPGLLIAGRNAITTDAVGVGIMGYDPQAGYAKHPFPGENHLQLLARAGLGTNDLARIEVRGLPLEEALHEYHPEHPEKGWIRRQRLKG